MQSTRDNSLTSAQAAGAPSAAFLCREAIGRLLNRSGLHHRRHNILHQYASYLNKPLLEVARKEPVTVYQISRACGTRLLIMERRYIFSERKNEGRLLIDLRHTADPLYSQKLLSVSWCLDSATGRLIRLTLAKKKYLTCQSHRRKCSSLRVPLWRLLGLQGPRDLMAAMPIDALTIAAEEKRLESGEEHPLSDQEMDTSPVCEGGKGNPMEAGIFPDGYREPNSRTEFEALLKNLGMADKVNVMYIFSLSGNSGMPLVDFYRGFKDGICAPFYFAAFTMPNLTIGYCSVPTGFNRSLGSRKRSSADSDRNRTASPVVAAGQGLPNDPFCIDDGDASDGEDLEALREDHSIGSPTAEGDAEEPVRRRRHNAQDDDKSDLGDLEMLESMEEKVEQETDELCVQSEMMEEHGPRRFAGATTAKVDSCPEPTKINRQASVSVKCRGLNLAYRLGLISRAEFLNINRHLSNLCGALWFFHDTDGHLRYAVFWCHTGSAQTQFVCSPPNASRRAKAAAAEGKALPQVWDLRENVSAWRRFWRDVCKLRDMLQKERLLCLSELNKKLSCYIRYCRDPQRQTQDVSKTVSSLFLWCRIQLLAAARRIKVYLFSPDDTLLHAIKVPLAAVLRKPRTRGLKLTCGKDGALTAVSIADFEFINLFEVMQEDVTLFMPKRKQDQFPTSKEKEASEQEPSAAMPLEGGYNRESNSRLRQNFDLYLEGLLTAVADRWLGEDWITTAEQESPLPTISHSKRVLKPSDHITLSRTVKVPDRSNNTITQGVLGLADHSIDMTQYQSFQTHLTNRGADNARTVIMIWCAFSELFARDLRFDLSSLQHTSPARISYDVVWSNYFRMGGPMVHAMEKPHPYVAHLLRPFCAGGFSYSFEDKLGQGEPMRKGQGQPAKYLVEYDLTSAYGYAASSGISSSASGFGMTFGHGMTPKNRYETFEYMAVMKTLSNICGKIRKGESKKVRSVYSNFSPLGLFYIGKHAIDLAVVFEDGTLALYQMDGHFAHGCYFRKGQVRNKAGLCHADRVSYVGNMARGEVEAATTWRDFFVEGWVKAVCEAQRSATAATYTVFRDCCSSGYSMSELRNDFYSIPDLAKLVLGTKDIFGCYDNRAGEKRSAGFLIPHINHAELCFFAVVNLTEDYTVPLQFGGQFGPLFPLQANLSSENASKTKTYRHLLTSDSYAYLSEFFGLRLRPQDVEFVVYYKRSDKLPSVFRWLTRLRSGEGLATSGISAKAAGRVIKKIVNFSCGYFGRNFDKDSPFATDIYLSDRTPINIDPNRHHISCADDTFDGLDYFVIKTSRRKKEQTQEVALAKRCATPLPLFISIVEMGKVRLNMIFQCMQHYFRPDGYQIVYSHVDNFIIALASDNPDQVLRNPEDLEDFSREWALFYNQDRVNEPGMLKKVWQVSDAKDISMASWQFVSPHTMFYAVLPCLKVSDNDDASESNLVSGNKENDYPSADDLMNDLELDDILGLDLSPAADILYNDLDNDWEFELAKIDSMQKSDLPMTPGTLDSEDAKEPEPIPGPSKPYQPGFHKASSLRNITTDQAFNYGTSLLKGQPFTVEQERRTDKAASVNLNKIMMLFNPKQARRPP